MKIKLEDLECYAITHWNFVRVIKETEIKQKYELIIVLIFSQIKFNSENKLVEILNLGHFIICLVLAFFFLSL